MSHFMGASRSLRLLACSLVAIGVFAGAVLLLRNDVVGPRAPAPSAERMAEELLQANERAGLCSSANAVGVGLRGEYFSEASFRGRAALVRVDDVVDFDPSLAWPSGVALRPASVRWSGWIKAPLSGRYLFHADAPNMRVTVARQVVAGVGTAEDNLVDLAAGRFYPIEITVSQLTDSGARIRLEWTAPHGARYVIPKALLHLPSETIATPRS